MSPDLGENTQKLDAAVDGKFPNNLDFASNFSKAIGHELPNGSNGDLFLSRRMNFANYPVQTQAPYFMDLGLPAINALNKSGVLSNPATNI